MPSRDHHGAVDENEHEHVVGGRDVDVDDVDVDDEHDEHGVDHDGDRDEHGGDDVAHHLLSLMLMCPLQQQQQQ